MMVLMPYRCYSTIIVASILAIVCIAHFTASILHPLCAWNTLIPLTLLLSFLLFFMLCLFSFSSVDKNRNRSFTQFGVFLLYVLLRLFLSFLSFIFFFDILWPFVNLKIHFWPNMCASILRLGVLYGNHSLVLLLTSNIQLLASSNISRWILFYFVRVFFCFLSLTLITLLYCKTNAFYYHIEVILLLLLLRYIVV